MTLGVHCSRSPSERPIHDGCTTSAQRLSGSPTHNAGGDYEVFIVARVPVDPGGSDGVVAPHLLVRANERGARYAVREEVESQVRGRRAVGKVQGRHVNCVDHDEVMVYAVARRRRGADVALHARVIRELDSAVGQTTTFAVTGSRRK